jgi:hypothetical protein
MAQTSLKEPVLRGKYTYRRLEKSDMIQLLEIYPGVTSDPLRGSIRHVKLIDVASSFDSTSRNNGNSAVLGDTYKAISYV